MTVNVGNIQKVIDRLTLDDGSHFIMQDFVQWIKPQPMGRYSDQTTTRADKWIECGTAMCVAGWANLIRMTEEGVDYKAITDSEFRQAFESWHKAREWLGIAGYGPAEDLFRCQIEDNVRFQLEGHTYIVAGMDGFDRLPNATKRAAGIRVLEILRDTGEVDWQQALVDVGGTVEVYNDYDD